MLFESVGEEFERVSAGRCEAQFYRVGRSTLVTRVTGCAEPELIDVLIRRSESLIKAVGTIEVFHDWFGVTAYKSEVRTRMTPWAKATSASHRAVHIGTESRVVRMGITMVQLVAGSNIIAYSSLTALDAALRASRR